LKPFADTPPAFCTSKATDWDYPKPLPAKGNIELQYHGHKLYWKNIYAKDLNIWTIFRSRLIQRAA
jgi:hypothetical protein